MNTTTLEARLTALAEKHGIPGASLAVAVGDDTLLATTGVLNIRTGAPVTPQSVFQIGSITKTWTATLVMQLVDEGLLDLDAPIITYLPDFRVLDDETTRNVTARHLLNHTSGIGGDFFPETGRGDDCIARYVDAMADLEVTYPLGATMSYCNAGFNVLGRIIEVLRGTTWDAVMRERLFEPLELEAAGTLPEEAILWGAAVGHFGTDVTEQWGLVRGSSPAGGIHARAVDLLTYARTHLSDGVAPNGARVLSAASTRSMREARTVIPGRDGGATHVGLSWMLGDWGHPAFGHDGQTLGQTAYLQVVEAPVPVTVALLVNSGESSDFYRELASELFAEHGGIVMPSPPVPPATPVTAGPSDVTGTYERLLMGFDVEQRDTGLVIVARPSGILAVSLGTDRIECELVPAGPDAYLIQLPGSADWSPVVFSEGDGLRFLHLGSRAARFTGRAAA
jgi:CubicO group peptidase (beta-lactamase class C family)